MRARVPVTCFLYAFTVIASPMLAQARPAFSADMQVTYPSGASTIGKIYYANGKARTEFDRGQNVMISDEFRKVTYLMWPQKQLYMVNTGDPKILLPMYNIANPCEGSKTATCKRLGTEVLNGRRCAKWSMTFTNGTPSRVMWIDQRVGVAVKLALQNGLVLEVTNIKEGPQNSNLFELPASYKQGLPF